ncbi:hypothetical protein MUG91_G3939n1 [Manis pentadactyla]|nr:hypothetical protein MUG91_G3939n1 [Manis pentadactyla]
MLTNTRVSGVLQTATGGGDSCVPELLPLSSVKANSGSPYDLSGILKMTWQSVKALAAVWISWHRQDDSGDVLLMIVKLTKSRVRGGTQTADGVEIHVSLIFCLSGQEGACSRMDLCKHCQDDSGDVLLMIVKLTKSRVSGGTQTADGVDIHVSLIFCLRSGRRLQPYGSLKHRQDDSGDLLLMMSRRRLQPYESLRHRQVDSGDVLLMIVKLIKTRVSGALQTCDGVKLTMTRVTGGIQTADGDGDSCVLDLLPLGRRWQPYDLAKHRQDDLVMCCSHDVKKTLAAVWIFSGIVKLTSGDVLLMIGTQTADGVDIHVSFDILPLGCGRRLQPYGSLRHPQDDSGDLLLTMSRRRLQPYESFRHRQVDSGDVLLMMSGRSACSRMDLCKHRQDDSGDVLLMMWSNFVKHIREVRKKALAADGSLKHCQDDSGDVLLMIVKLTKSRVSGGTQTADGVDIHVSLIFCLFRPVMGMGIHVSVSCCLEVRKAACHTVMDFLRLPQDESGDLLLMVVKLTMTHVTGGIQTADGDGDSCVLDSTALGQEDACSRMNLTGIVKLTLVMCCS